MQSSDLSRLIFPIGSLIATISEFTELLPGDIILTGTPSGGGYRRNPRSFSSRMMWLPVEVTGVGSITNTVRAPN